LRRKARGVELTDAGLSFLEEARATLAQLERAVESTRRTARGELGRICVGVTSTSSLHPLVARSIRAFSEACPKVSLTLEESLSNVLLEDLRNERMDVAFVRTAPATAEGLAMQPLLEEPMVAALPSSHSLAKGAKESAIPLKRLAPETFILYGPPGTGMYDTIIAACHAAGFNPNVGNLGASSQQGPRIGSTLSLVAAGLGITFVPSSLQRMNVEGVAYRRIKGAAPPTARLVLATRRGDPSPTVKQFVSLVRSTAKAV
jgi:DNA-binding transcriptional LysR family regulator